ncbi:unnamed protein product [Toxocara canis]|uniref:RalBP1-associated Eps domain-containing protein 2 n=1 Tax=Toxocara canis TaxID=6265 RepID=A0A183UZ16_TOXCA|nr:unnamed protein product [Toxocara canis]
MNFPDVTGVSDTETRNLLEDGAEDEDDEPDSDGANTINAAHSNASSQIAQVGEESFSIILVPWLRLSSRLHFSTSVLIVQMQAESESKGKGDGPTGMDDDSLFEMSEQQKDYYCKCFVYLIKLTQGLVDLKGAVHGADEKVVDFFKKSNLGTDTLSRIWALSDVNEDGFLDLAEFSTAMHLIVLNIKGQIAIPERLPDSIRPPLTPPRNVNALSDGKWRVQSSSGMSNSAQHNWRQFDFDESRGRISPLQTHHQQQYHSLSDDHLHLHIAKSETPEHLSDFSDVPPLLVDGRPTALKATQPVICSTQVPACPSLKAPFSSEALRLTLSPPAPKGPPPKPPPRPANKGHGRSASLDLNTLASAVTLGGQPQLWASGSIFADFRPSAGIYAGIATAQRSGTLPAHASLRFHPSPPTISESPGAAPLPALPQGLLSFFVTS